MSVLKTGDKFIDYESSSISADNNGDSTASPIKHEIRAPSSAMLFHRLLAKEPMIVILQQSARL